MFDGSEVDFTVLLTESVMARLHVVVDTPDGAPAVDPLALEAELAALVAREWVDDLHDAFVEARGEEAGVESHRRWMRAFPAAYQFEVDADVAVADVAVLETLDPGGDLADPARAAGRRRGADQALPGRGRRWCSPTSCRSSSTSA